MAILYNKETELSGHVVPGYIPTPNDVVRIEQPPQPDLTYHGGSVQTSVKIYLVFWGSEWSSSGDPEGVRSRYSRFIGGVGGSRWMSTVAQYAQSDGARTANASGSYAGAWIDTLDARPNLNTRDYQSAFAAEAAKAASHFGDASIGADYVIATPHGTAVYGFAGNYGGPSAYCAWHSDTSALLAYTVLPYIPDAGNLCGAGSVNTPGSDDGVSIVGGHEQAEAQTDPHLDAWYDSSGNEVADKCAWRQLQNQTFSTGTYPTQPLWSNSAGGCVQ